MRQDFTIQHEIKIVGLEELIGAMHVMASAIGVYREKNEGPKVATIPVEKETVAIQEKVEKKKPKEEKVEKVEKKKPKEEKTVETPKAEAPTISFDTVRKLASTLISENKDKQVKEIIAEYGGSIFAVPPDKLHLVHESLKALQ